MNKRDIDKIEKGRIIAKQIVSIMNRQSASDSKVLDNWLSNNKYSKDVVNSLTDEQTIDQMVTRFRNNNKEEQVNMMAKSIARISKQRLRKRIIFTTTSIVAVMIAVSLLVINPTKYTTEDVDNSSSMIKGVVVQKMNVPILITDSGNKVDLLNNQIINNRDEYIKNEKTVDNTATEKNKNIVVIPERYVHEVVLADGTKVLLNPKSTLEYPTTFDKEYREVILTGEAFFDVTKSPKPFVVKVRNSKIKVYGTRFNVNAYKDNIIKTSLLSGSVGVSSGNFDEVIIKPNQEIILNQANNEYNIDSFNAEKYEAWLRGYFRADNEYIGNILNDVSKWYGVKFEYEYEDSKRIKTTLSVSRDADIKEVLELLRISSNISIMKKGGDNNTYIVK